MSLIISLARSFFGGLSNGRKWDPDTGLPDLSGKVAIVTGGNTGIGFVTAQALHKKGCKVYIACRSEQRARDAMKRINEANPGSEASLVYLPFDLTDLKSAKTAAETVKEKEDRLDIIVCNAGIMAWPYEIKNGVEVQFYNHLGHFALLHHLLPLLKETAKKPGASVRVVSVSSTGHILCNKPDFSSLEAVNRKMGNTWARYGQSKLANILFAVALAERCKDDNIRVNACHPGVIRSELWRGPESSWGWISAPLSFAAQYFGMSLLDGAKTQIYLAASPEVDEKDYRGGYFLPIANPAKPNKHAQNRELAEQLWKLSEALVAKAQTE
ncbi:hypothetical protein JCM8097_000566 [Rhodosporidiobolus ruineniae]